MLKMKFKNGAFRDIMSSEALLKRPVDWVFGCDLDRSACGGCDGCNFKNELNKDGAIKWWIRNYDVEIYNGETNITDLFIDKENCDNAVKLKKSKTTVSESHSEMLNTHLVIQRLLSDLNICFQFDFTDSDEYVIDAKKDNICFEIYFDRNNKITHIEY